MNSDTQIRPKKQLQQLAVLYHTTYFIQLQSSKQFKLPLMKTQFWSRQGHPIFEFQQARVKLIAPQNTTNTQIYECMLQNMPLQTNSDQFSIQSLLKPILSSQITDSDKILYTYKVLYQLYESIKFVTKKQQKIQCWLSTKLQLINKRMKQMKTTQKMDPQNFQGILTRGWSLRTPWSSDLEIRVRLCIILTLSFFLISKSDDNIDRILTKINQIFFLKVSDTPTLSFLIRLHNRVGFPLMPKTQQECINQLMYHQLEFITIDKDMCQGQHHYIWQPPAYEWRCSNKTKSYLQYLQNYSKVKNIVLIVNMEHVDLMRVYPYLSDINLVFYYGQNKYSFKMLETQFYKIPINKEQGEVKIFEKLRQIYLRKSENIRFPNFSYLNTDQHSNISFKAIPNIRILKWITSDYDTHYKYKDIFIKFLNSQATKHRFQWNDNLSREQIIHTINNNNLYTKIIYYYTVDSPFYQIINRALRPLGHIPYLSYFKYPLKTFYKQIQSLYLKKQQPIGKFYRCCYLTNAEFQYLTRPCNIGKFIMLEGISSFHHQPIPNFGPCCLIVEVDEHIKSEKIGGYADISKMSQFMGQKQVIFNFLNYFQIIGVSQKLEYKQDDKVLFQQIVKALSKFEQKQEISLYKLFHKKLSSFKQKYGKYNGQLYSIIIQKLQKYEQKQGIDNGQLYQQIHTTLQKFKQKYEDFNARITTKMHLNGFITTKIIKLKLVIPSELQKKQKLTNHEKSLLDIYKSQNKKYVSQSSLYRQIKMDEQYFYSCFNQYFLMIQKLQPAQIQIMNTQSISIKSQFLDEFQKFIKFRYSGYFKTPETLKAFICLLVLQLIYEQKLQRCLLYTYSKLDDSCQTLFYKLLIQLQNNLKIKAQISMLDYINCKILQYSTNIQIEYLRQYKKLSQYNKGRQRQIMEIMDQQQKPSQQLLYYYDKFKQSQRLMFEQPIKTRQYKLNQLRRDQYKFFNQIQLFCDLLIVTFWEYQQQENSQKILQSFAKYHKQIKFLAYQNIQFIKIVKICQIVKQNYIKIPPNNQIKQYIKWTDQIMSHKTVQGKIQKQYYDIQAIKQISFLQILDDKHNKIIQYESPRLQYCNMLGLQIKILNYQVFKYLTLHINSFQTWKLCYQSLFNKKVSWLVFRNNGVTSIILQNLMESILCNPKIRQKVVKDEVSLQKILKIHNLNIMFGQIVLSRKVLLCLVENYCDYYLQKRLHAPSFCFLIQFVIELSKMGCLKFVFKKIEKLWNRITEALCIKVAFIDALISPNQKDVIEELLQFIYKYENNNYQCLQKVLEKQQIARKNINELFINFKKGNISQNGKIYLQMFTEFIQVANLSEYKLLLKQKQLICTELKYYDIKVSYFINAYEIKAKQLLIQQQFLQYKQQLLEIVRKNHLSLLFKQYKHMLSQQQNQASQYLKKVISSNFIKQFQFVDQQLYNNMNKSCDIVTVQNSYRIYQTKICQSYIEKIGNDKLQNILFEFLAQVFPKMYNSHVKWESLIDIAQLLLDCNQNILADLCLQIALNQILLPILVNKKKIINETNKPYLLNEHKQIQLYKFSLDLLKRISNIYQQLYMQQQDLSKLYVKMIKLIVDSENNITREQFKKDEKYGRIRNMQDANRLQYNIEYFFNIKQVVYEKREQLGLNQFIKKWRKQGKQSAIKH